jgi:hypothetical protein
LNDDSDYIRRPVVGNRGGRRNPRPPETSVNPWREIAARKTYTVEREVFERASESAAYALEVEGSSELSP